MRDLSETVVDSESLFVRSWTLVGPSVCSSAAAVNANGTFTAAAAVVGSSACSTMAAGAAGASSFAGKYWFPGTATSTAADAVSTIDERDSWCTTSADSVD